MKRLIIVLALFGLSLNAQTIWKLDAGHSKIGFSVTHLMISEVEGSFKAIDGTVEATKADFQDSKISLTIDAKSVNTEVDDRDKHLKSADFFDTEKFPQLKFVSKSFKKVKGNKYKLVGDLTIKDVTKQVSLDVTFKGAAKDPWGNEKAGFKLEGKINRYDFNLKWNKALETGGVIVGQDVKLNINVELQRQKQ